MARELIAWGNDYAQIDNDASALRAARMIPYVRTYYVPSDGYRGFYETERELAIARDASLRNITDALERYTGLEYGDDYSAWSRWADSPKQLGGEP